MFLKLNECSNKEPIYINSNEIRKFYKYERINDQTIGNTIVELQYGNIIVKETPETIMEMLKGSN